MKHKGCACATCAHHEMLSVTHALVLVEIKLIIIMEITGICDY